MRRPQAIEQFINFRADQTSTATDTDTDTYGKQDQVFPSQAFHFRLQTDLPFVYIVNQLEKDALPGTKGTGRAHLMPLYALCLCVRVCLCVCI